MAVWLVALLITQPADPDTGSPSDEAAIRKALEADEATAAPAPAATAAAPATQTPPSTSVLNPAISAIVDASFGYYGRRPSDFAGIGIPPAGDDPSSAHEGFTLQEVELAFQTAVDPYFQGAVFLTIPNLEGVEVEEAYLLTTALPWNLQVKAGSFRSQVGRNNTQHLHLQNFTRRPLMTTLLLGADGLRAPGVQASVLIPGLPWFATLYAEALSVGPPDGGVATFGGGKRGPASLVYAAVLEQFWPLSDAVSVMLGFNFARGVASVCDLPPCSDGPRSILYGGDLYFKWRPPDVVGESMSLSWATEYFKRHLGNGIGTEGAFFTEPLLQLARRYYVGLRYDLTGVPRGENVPRRHGIAASLTFAPTEFSRLRLYGQRLSGPGVTSALVGFLQAEFSLGAHGAHAF